MNAKSQQQTPVINSWLDNAIEQLKAAGIPSAQLDAELILDEILGKDRTFLHAHPEQIIYSKQLKKANLYLKKRIKRIPLAYVFGYKEFYGRNFKVNHNTLIPRPESEEIIEILSSIIIPAITNRPLFGQTDCAKQPFAVQRSHELNLVRRRVCCLDEQRASGFKKISLLDIGTGTGCLGITAKLEFPNLDVILTDISQKALNVAKFNAKALKSPVKTLKSDLLDEINSKVDIIIANLPYVDKSWEVSPEVKFEPDQALYANDDGQELIKKLIIQSENRLNNNGYLILETDPRQHNSLTKYAIKHNFKLESKSEYVILLKYIK